MLELKAFLEEQKSATKNVLLSEQAVLFLESKGFVKIQVNDPLYSKIQAGSQLFIQEMANDLGRVEQCEVYFSGMMDVGSGCWAGIYEMSSDCYHANCLKISWDCEPGSGQTGSYYMC